ncbi:MAG: VWA domain-containing protein [Saprospiraceae bacterium]
MFQFENSYYFYWLLLIPTLILFQRWVKINQQKGRHSFAHPNVIQSLFVLQTSTFSKYKNFVFLFGLTLLIVSLANPRYGYKKKDIEMKSSDIYIALDISHSMNAKDVLPSRLEKAKKFTIDLIHSLKGNRIGIIFFAGNAYLQMPLSIDYASALMYIQTIQTAMAPTQGSAIAEAIDLTQKLHEEKNQGQKALIIISDGDDHDGSAIDVAESAASNGLNIFTIGVGSLEGSTIPIMDDEGEDLAREQDGSLAISKFNPTLLKEIGQKGNGSSHLLQNASKTISEIQQKVSLLQKKDAEIRSFTEFNSYYYVFLILGIICFILFLLLPEVNKKMMLSTFSLLVLYLPANTQSAHKLLRNGDDLYGMNRFMEAEKQYDEAYKKEKSFQSMYNKGNALYQQKNYPKAEGAYTDAIQKTSNSIDLGKTYHNLGNSYFQQQKYQESVEAYKSSLKHQPNDNQTIENLLKARKLLKQQRQENKNNKQQEQKKNQEKEEQNKSEPDDSTQENNEQNPQNNQENQPNQPKNLSKEEAEKLLDIIENEDKKVNKKVRRGSTPKKPPLKPW